MLKLKELAEGLRLHTWSVDCPEMRLGCPSAPGAERIRRARIPPTRSGRHHHVQALSTAVVRPAIHLPRDVRRRPVFSATTSSIGSRPQNRTAPLRASRAHGYRLPIQVLWVAGTLDW